MNKYDENNLLDLFNLKDGWNYGEGNSISEDSIYIAITLSRAFNYYNKIEYIEAFPTDDGYVNLCLGIDNKNIIGLLIESEDRILVYLENEHKIIDQGECTLGQIMDKVESIIKKTNIIEDNPWRYSLDSCIVNTIQNKEVHSFIIASLSETSYLEVSKMDWKNQYHLSTKYVQEISANISPKNSTCKELHPNHTLSGTSASNNTSYRPSYEAAS